MIVFLVRPSLVALSSLLLSLSLSPCRSHPVFIFCLAILLAFCLLFSATRQLLSDIEKLGCGCHTRAPKPISVSCVCRGAEARTCVLFSKGKDRRFGEGLLGEMYNRIAAGGFGRAKPAISVLTPPPPPFSVGGRACALCNKAVSKEATCTSKTSVWAG